MLIWDIGKNISESNNEMDKIILMIIEMKFIEILISDIEKRVGKNQSIDYSMSSV